MMTAEELIKKWSPRFEGLTWEEIFDKDWEEFLEDFKNCLDSTKLIDGWSTEA